MLVTLAQQDGVALLYDRFRLTCISRQLVRRKTIHFNENFNQKVPTVFYNYYRLEVALISLSYRLWFALLYKVCVRCPANKLLSLLVFLTLCGALEAALISLTAFFDLRRCDRVCGRCQYTSTLFLDLIFCDALEAALISLCCDLNLL